MEIAQFGKGMCNNQLQQAIHVYDIRLKHDSRKHFGTAKVKGYT